MAEKIPKIRTSGSSTPISHTPSQQVASSNKNGEKQVDADPVVTEDELENEWDQEEEEEKPSGPHFDTVDTFFYISIAVLGDIFDGIWVTRIFFAPTTLLFLYLKGVDQMISKNMLSQGIELVPVIGWLPISTTMAIYTIVMTNHPELLDKLGAAGDALKKVNEVSKKKKL